MQINNLRYLLALDRERHFARAARACNVSQPTLSAGIAALEAQLGRLLVVRDRRFIDLTSDGRAVLPWARQAMAALDGLSQAARATEGPLQGELRLGVIPASMPITGMIATALRVAYPHVRLAIHSLPSREIAQRLTTFDLDAGITYIDHEPPGHIVAVPLYAESMTFVNRGGERSPASIGWEAALAQPLCLLHQGMQNRRILDASLAGRGLAVSPAAVADSYVALIALVETGAFATIMPDTYAPLLPGWSRMTLFDDPIPPTRIGLVVPDRSPLAPLALAALDIAERVRAGIDRK
ncbi:MAG TPA: LysR family transcriptional regulator [Sphingomonas sp.]|nr:LysR family transcriptional regulator [Sphingomonas sp.]